VSSDALSLQRKLRAAISDTYALIITNHNLSWLYPDNWSVKDAMVIIALAMANEMHPMTLVYDSSPMRTTVFSQSTIAVKSKAIAARILPVLIHLFPNAVQCATLGLYSVDPDMPRAAMFDVP